MSDPEPLPRPRTTYLLLELIKDSILGVISVFLVVVHAVAALLASLTREKSALQYLLIAVTEIVSVFGTYFGHNAMPRLNMLIMFNAERAFTYILVYSVMSIQAICLLILVFTAILVALPIALLTDVLVAITQNPEDDVEVFRPIRVEDYPGNKLSGSMLLLLVFLLLTQFSGNHEVGHRCSSDTDCASGLSCKDWSGFAGKKCVRTTVTNPFNTVDTSLPFNKFAFLTTHNSFSITGSTRFTFFNQEDSVMDQLNNGVRALMLDVYDFQDDIWLCHSLGASCYDVTSFEPAITTLRKIEAFLLTNPSEIVTLILEDHVSSDRGLSKLVNRTGLGKYWFPVKKMPRDGNNWPLVSDMIKNNHRLLVFTSNRTKELTEGIAYQWNYMVENQYGDDGMDPDACYKRSESSLLFDRTKSLVFVNYFRTIPRQAAACMEHSQGLLDVLKTCHAAAGNRWANFLAVDYYKRSDGGGVFEATDMLNGKLICGSDDVRACKKGTLKKAFDDLLVRFGITWKDIPTTEVSEVLMEDPEFNPSEETTNIEMKLGDNVFHDEL